MREPKREPAHQHETIAVRLTGVAAAKLRMPRIVQRRRSDPESPPGCVVFAQEARVFLLQIRARIRQIQPWPRGAGGVGKLIVGAVSECECISLLRLDQKELADNR